MPYYVLIKDKDGSILWRSKPLFAAFEIISTVIETINDFIEHRNVIDIFKDHPYEPAYARIVTDDGVFIIETIWEVD